MIRVKILQDPQVHIKTGATVTVSDGGYERGYAAGYDEGRDAEQRSTAGIFDETSTLVSNSFVSYLRKFALAFNATVESILFENVQSTGEHAFYQCYQLKNVHLPNLTTPGTYVFRDCTSLETLILPKVATLTYGICQAAKNLVRVDTSSVIRVDNAAFLDCAAMTALILRNSRVAVLAATRAFTGTPIANGTGYVYVPAALVEQYKSAANWSTYAAQIRAIEDYPEICGT